MGVIIPATTTTTTTILATIGATRRVAVAAAPTNALAPTVVLLTGHIAGLMAPANTLVWPVAPLILGTRLLLRSLICKMVALATATGVPDRSGQQKISI